MQDSIALGGVRVCRVAMVVPLLSVLCAGCGGSNSGDRGGTSPPPPPAITLTLTGPYDATLQGNNWVVAGVPGFTLLATGTGFTSTSVFEWNGTMLPTQYGSSTSLAATVSSTLVADPGTASIAIYDPASGAKSNSLSFGIASPATATAGVAQMITVAPDGSPANADSLVAPSLSATGRYVSFQSAATNLGAGLASNYQQIYERDTCIGAPAGCSPNTIPISVTYDGSPLDGPSRVSSISGDGRYVSFDSDATNILNLPEAQTLCPQLSCVYVRDTCIGASAGCVPRTILVSTDVNGNPVGGGAPAISPDGRYVGYESTGTSPGIANIYLRDTCLGGPSTCSPSTILISGTFDGEPANALSVGQSVSSGGRFVVFDSYATNLIPNDNSTWPDVFLRDTCIGAPSPCTQTTVRVSISTDGTQANGASESNGWQPSISSDGHLITWFSAATNMVSQNVNGFANVYLHDTCFGAVQACSPTTTLGSIANDRSIPNYGQNNQSMSANGRFIAFASLANNLVPGDTFPAGGWKDIFVHDTCFSGPSGCTSSTVRVSVTNTPSFATQSNAISDYPRISGDGHYLVFLSAATNLVRGVTGNGHTMVYLAKTGF